MNVAGKLTILADAAKYDASCASSGTEKRNSLKSGIGSLPPAPGTAEVWAFEVQYHLQNAPFGQMSQQGGVTVRG